MPTIPWLAAHLAHLTLDSGVPEIQPPPKKQTMPGRLSVANQFLGLTTNSRSSVSPTLRKTNASLPGMDTGVVSAGFSPAAACAGVGLGASAASRTQAEPA